MKIYTASDDVVFKRSSGQLDYTDCHLLYAMMKLARALRTEHSTVTSYDDDMFTFSNRRVRR